jgi:adenylate cyclase
MRAHWGWNVSIVLVTAVLAALITFFMRSAKALLVVAAALAGLFVSSYLLFLHGRLIVDVIPAAFGMVGATGTMLFENFIAEQQQRGQLMQIFSKHVSPEIASAIWKDRAEFLTGGRLRSQKLHATVLFSDLVGFTSIAERLDTAALMDWINEYMETMAKLVMQYGGVVDDYYGDAIKANFGVPFPRALRAEHKDDAHKAVSCALAMGQELTLLNRKWRDRGLPAVGMRIGISSGEVVAGCIGSSERMKFTTIGDTVNTAARLESYDKHIASPETSTDPCRVLVSESTLRLVRKEFSGKPIGKLSLKGKSEEVSVYLILPPQGRSA